MPLFKAVILLILNANSFLIFWPEWSYFHDFNHYSIPSSCSYLNSLNIYLKENKKKSIAITACLTFELIKFLVNRLHCVYFDLIIRFCSIISFVANVSKECLFQISLMRNFSTRRHNRNFFQICLLSINMIHLEVKKKKKYPENMQQYKVPICFYSLIRHLL